MSPAVVALSVAGIAALGGVLASVINSRATTKTTVQNAVAKTLEEVWNQRVLFRDEQIAELRAELAEQAERHTAQISEQGEKHTAQIAQLSSEIERLTDLVVQLGGVPHE